MYLIDILISDDSKFGTSYMFTIYEHEYSKLQDLIASVGKFIKLYRNSSFDNESEYNDIIKQYNLSE
jgi:hypothetical protein